MFAAVWFAAIVTVFAVAVTRESRTATRIATHHLEAARAGAAADAGLVWLQAVLAAEAKGVRLPRGTASDVPNPLPAGRPVRLDGTRYGWRHEDVGVVLSAESEAGKLSLNGADPVVLGAVLARLLPRDADRIVQAILTRRSGADRQGRISWRLGDTGFERIEDLAALPGMTAEAYGALAPHVTAHGTLRTPDAMTARPDLFRLLPLDDDGRRQITAARGADQSLAAWTGKPVLLTLRARARTPDGTVGAAAALVRINPAATAPVSVIRRLPGSLAVAD